MGLLITLLTFEFAGTGTTGGVFFVAFGPVIGGILMIARAVGGGGTSRLPSRPPPYVPPWSAAPPSAGTAACPVCRTGLTWGPAYRRWYCPACQAYR